MQCRIQQDHAALLRRLGVAARHHLDGLGDGGGFVEKRGPGHRQTRQVRHGGLEIEQRLEAALRNLRLVGRVGGVPAGVLHDVAADDRRSDGVVVPGADELLLHRVLRREPAQGCERPGFVEGVGKLGGLGLGDVGGQRGGGQLGRGVVAEEI